MIAAATLAACSDPDTLESGTVLAEVDDVPEGGTIPVLAGDTAVLLSRTAGGDLRAFSAICTHQGCKVLPPEAGEDVFVCPCHRSEFDAFTGAVLKGPAEEDLHEFDVVIEGGKVIIG